MIFIRRLLISFAGGLLIPFALFWLVFFGEGFLKENVNNEGVGANIVYGAIVWPILLSDRIFPQSPNCPSCGPSEDSIKAAIIIYFIFYSAVTYTLQIVVAKLWTRRHRSRKALS